MSADNWRECPCCNKKQLNEKEKAKIKADSCYGKVSQEEYLKLLEIANKPIKLENSLREDYSLYVSLDGEFRVSYSCYKLWITRQRKAAPLGRGFSLLFLYRGLIVGNKITSLMFLVLVRSIQSLSIPIPTPPAGGIPYSRASINSSSFG